jgi:hypothetical protein
MLPMASLPHPADPMFISLGATLGGWVGRATAKRLRYDADKTMLWTVEGGYFGTAVALCVYLAGNFVMRGVLACGFWV